MKNQQTLLDKIKLQQSVAASQQLEVKLQKIKLFISNSDEDLPVLTSQLKGTDQVSILLRIYFNDQQLLIFKNYNSPQSYLQQEEFNNRISLIFDKFLEDNPHYIDKQNHSKSTSQNNTSNRSEIQNSRLKKQTGQNKQQKGNKQQFSNQNALKIDFIQFIQYWLENMSDIKVFYQKYQQIVKNSVEKYQDNLYRTVSNNPSKQNSSRQLKKQSNQRLNKQNKQKIIRDDQDNKAKNQKKPQTKQKLSMKVLKSQKQTQKQSSQNRIKSHQQKIYQQQQYDQQQYEQYKPKSSKSIKSQLVHEQHEQPKDSFTYYLRKFYDLYCKKAVNTNKNQQFGKLINFYNSMNLTKFMMYCKDLKLLKINKTVTAKYLQVLFKNNQNQQHSVEFDNFCKIVKQVLQTQFKEQQDCQNQGFQYIGVKNRPNFAEVMGRIGVIVPLKKIIFAKQQENRALSRLVKSKTKQQALNLKQSLLKDSIVGNAMLKNGGYGRGYQSNWDSNKLQKDLFMNQKQRKQQRLLQNLTIPKLNKLQPSKQMDDKLHQLVDEQYDPYLKRYNQRNTSSYEPSNNNGVIKRIDERIHNIVKKIR